MMENSILILLIPGIKQNKNLKKALKEIKKKQNIVNPEKDIKINELDIADFEMNVKGKMQNVSEVFLNSIDLQQTLESELCLLMSTIGKATTIGQDIIINHKCQSQEELLVKIEAKSPYLNHTILG